MRLVSALNNLRARRLRSAQAILWGLMDQDIGVLQENGSSMTRQRIPVSGITPYWMLGWTLNSELIGCILRIGWGIEIVNSGSY